MKCTSTRTFVDFLCFFSMSFSKCLSLFISLSLTHYHKYTCLHMLFLSPYLLERPNKWPLTNIKAKYFNFISVQADTEKKLISFKAFETTLRKFWVNDLSTSLRTSFFVLLCILSLLSLQFILLEGRKPVLLHLHEGPVLGRTTDLEMGKMRVE